MLDAASSGFVDPVLDAQAHFRALMNALAHPGRIVAFATTLHAPEGLTPELAAVALTLADHETTLWLDRPLAANAAIAAYLAFHAGARITDDPAAADFALVSDFEAMPALDAFAQGDDAYPDRSTTIVAAVRALVPDGGLVLSGPGIESERRLRVAPWPDGLTDGHVANRARFPRGVDLVLAAPGHVAALPRTTRIREV